MAKGTQEEGLELLRDIARLNGHSPVRIDWKKSTVSGYYCEAPTCGAWVTFPKPDTEYPSYIGSACYNHCGRGKMIDSSRERILIAHLRKYFEGNWGF